MYLSLVFCLNYRHLTWLRLHKQPNSIWHAIFLANLHDSRWRIFLSLTQRLGSSWDNFLATRGPRLPPIFVIKQFICRRLLWTPWICRATFPAWLSSSGREKDWKLFSIDRRAGRRDAERKGTVQRMWPFWLCNMAAIREQNRTRATCEQGVCGMSFRGMNGEAK